jgi:hypothetical protein
MDAMMAAEKDEKTGCNLVLLMDTWMAATKEDQKGSSMVAL